MISATLWILSQWFPNICLKPALLCSRGPFEATEKAVLYSKVISRLPFPDMWLENIIYNGKGQPLYAGTPMSSEMELVFEF